MFWTLLAAASLSLVGASTGATGHLSAARDVSVVPAAGGASRVLAQGARPSVSPDGRLVAYLREGRIWVMRADGTEQRQLTTSTGGRPFWSPDGRRLVFTAWNLDGCSDAGAIGCAVTDVWIVNADGTGERKLLARALQPAWSPDGRRLLFRTFVPPALADMTVGALKVARADGSHAKTVFPAKTDDGTRSQPAWSPDGKWIAFDWMPGLVRQHRLYLIRPDGSGVHWLTTGTYPAWSPNGKLIAFERDERVGPSTKTAVWVIPAVGGKARRIVGPDAFRGRCPTWSPGGTRIAFHSTVYRSQGEELPLATTTLALVRPDGSGRRVLSVADPCILESSFPAPASWSRDGRSVLYGG